MQIELLKAKIHRATVTDSDLNYIGSITLDPLLMEAAGLFPHEKVGVLNVQNGARFETYVISGKVGSGEVVLNGPAARLVHRGDYVIVVSYALMTPEEARNHQPKIVHVDEHNQPIPSSAT